MKKFIMSFVAALALASCTPTLQVIDTHGTSSNLADDTPTASPTVSPTITVPISATK